MAAEELCHLEMVAATVNMLNGHDPDAMHATVGSVEAHVLTGRLTAFMTAAPRRTGALRWMPESILISPVPADRALIRRKASPPASICKETPRHTVLLWYAAGSFPVGPA